MAGFLIDTMMGQGLSNRLVVIEVSGFGCQILNFRIQLHSPKCDFSNFNFIRSSHPETWHPKPETLCDS
jgi:hypothetical protein